MATTKKHRTAAFVPSTEQQDLLDQFEEMVADGQLASTRKQAKWLFQNASMTVGDIAVYLDKRFQQIYQATR